AALTENLCKNGLRVLALVSVAADRELSDAVAAGAIAVLPCDASEHELATAIQDAAAGRKYVSPSLLRPRTVGPMFSLLSNREREVFAMLVKGMSNRQIGKALTISAKTVETHRGRIYHKLGAHSVADLVHAAYREGVLH